MSKTIEISRELSQNWLSYMLASDSPQLKIWASLLGSALAAPAVERQEPVALPERKVIDEKGNGDRWSMFDKGFNCCLDGVEAHGPLYTSPPAPVAVVLPECKPDVNQSFEGTDADWYGNIGWNACLDKVKEMNK